MATRNVKQPKVVVKQSGKKSDSITVTRRRIFVLGGSFAITLPGSWVRRHGLDVGSRVSVIADTILQVVATPE